jgi:hypothetical protein
MYNLGSTFYGFTNNSAPDNDNTNPDLFNDDMNNYVSFSAWDNGTFPSVRTQTVPQSSGGVDSFGNSILAYNFTTHEVPINTINGNAWYTWIIPNDAINEGIQQKIAYSVNGNPNALTTSIMDSTIYSSTFTYTGTTIPVGTYRVYTTFADLSFYINNNFNTVYFKGDTVIPASTPTPTPTVTPTNTETPTPTVTPTNTETPTPTVTPTNTETPTPTVTPTNTETPTPTVTPTNTETPTPTVTPTNTETPTNTNTPTITSTPTNTNTPTPSTTPSIVSSGLVIQLDAYESSSYPGTGTTVFDITGGYDHTLIGATYTVLNGIKCFDCTTGNNRVDYNLTGPLLPNSGYTYITWARLIPSNAGFRTVLYTKGPPKITPITIPNGTNTLGYWATGFVSSGDDVSSSAGVWVQFAVVGTNTSQTFYINGSQVGSTINEGAGGTTHWGWGNNDTVAQPWGHVANMYFYNRQLSLTEITQQYNYLAPRFVEPTPTPTNTPTPTSTPAVPVTTNLVLYYDPSNSSSYPGTGTTINDLSVNGLNGSMSGITFTTPYFSYNGTSSQVRVADSVLLEPGSGDWTM